MQVELQLDRTAVGERAAARLGVEERCPYVPEPAPDLMGRTPNRVHFGFHAGLRRPSVAGVRLALSQERRRHNDAAEEPVDIRLAKQRRISHGRTIQRRRTSHQDICEIRVLAVARP